MSERRFFFDPDPTENDRRAGELVRTLTDVGVVKDSPDQPMGVETRANMAVLESPLLRIEYGPYENDYAIHLTPIHPRLNLRDERAVHRLLLGIIPVVMASVPTTLLVDLFLPRPEWQMKVLSFVFRGAATAWNFDRAAVEATLIPELSRITQEEILRG